MLWLALNVNIMNYYCISLNKDLRNDKLTQKIDTRRCLLFL